MKIYKISCTLTEKLYIGQTAGKIEYRFRDHCRKSEKGYEYAISHAIAKYGKENFTIEEIDTAETLEELNAKEIYWIAFYNSVAPFGFNLSGGGLNCKMSDETRAKMSASGKGKVPWNVGVFHSEETKKLISEKMMGNQKWLGKTHSEETRRKLSESRIGVPTEYNRGPRIDISKAVIRIEDNKRYDSVKDAADDINAAASNVSRFLAGKSSHVKGFTFKYEGQDPPVFTKKPTNSIGIICTTTGQTFESALSAAKELNIPYSGIYKNLRKLSNDYNGLKFEYVEEKTTLNPYDKTKKFQAKIDIRRKVRCLNTGKIFESVESAAKSIGTTGTRVSKAAKNPEVTVLGYHFEYIDKDPNDGTEGNSI